MNKQIKGISQINIIILWVVLVVSYAFIAIMGYYFKNPPKQGFTPKDFVVELPPNKWTKPIKTIMRMPWLDDYYMMQSLMWNVPISFGYIETEYLGRYFITAYCPEECGWSWQTSSGATCHYSSDWKTPTTCAIDRKHHNFGEYIMVGDPNSDNKKIYVTEDTGSGVKGLWVDCFVATMAEVRAWNTRYDSVYSVRFKTKTIDGNLYKTKKIMDAAIMEILMPSEIEYYKFGD